MNIEQSARDYVTKMNDPEKIKVYLTADAMVSGGVIPQPIPAMEAIKLLSSLTASIPDMKFDVQQVTENGNQATVKVQSAGAHSGPLSLPIPGMPTLPPTGKVGGDSCRRTRKWMPAGKNNPVHFARFQRQKVYGFWN